MFFGPVNETVYTSKLAKKYAMSQTKTDSYIPCTQLYDSKPHFALGCL